ncbi:hypothetical protein H0X10_00955 [Candidatus Saccharibacteria bacterium]|nr:hypothetical protein [Candidatus Saccharibacteria bacterium]
MQNNEQNSSNEVNSAKSDKRTRLIQKFIVGGLGAGLVAASFAAIDGLGGSDEKTPAIPSTTEVPSAPSSTSTAEVAPSTSTNIEVPTTMSSPTPSISENPIVVTRDDVVTP